MIEKNRYDFLGFGLKKNDIYKKELKKAGAFISDRKKKWIITAGLCFCLVR